MSAWLCALEEALRAPAHHDVCLRFAGEEKYVCADMRAPQLRLVNAAPLRPRLGARA